MPSTKDAEARPPEGFRQLSAARRLRIVTLAALQRRLRPSSNALSGVKRALPRALVRPLRRALSPLRLSPFSFDADIPVESEFPHTACEALPRSLSVLVPAFGNADLTLRCLRSVLAHTPAGTEVLVIDDASPDDTFERLSLFAQNHPISLHRNNNNLGFPRTVNRAAALSKGELLLVLNSDVVVTRGWVHGMFAALEAEADAGLVGPLGSDTGDVASFAANYQSVGELELVVASLAGRGVRRVKKLSLFCALLDRKVFESVGGLDERYDRGLFDDDDLCMALRKRGYSILLCENTFVHHNAGSSFRKLSALEYVARFEVNRFRFERKWQVRWRAHVPD